MNVPMKGWTLVDVEDYGAIEWNSPMCAYCNKWLRWVHVLRHPDVEEELRVGGMCVHSFIDKDRAEEALAFYRAKWKQRKRYFHKEAYGQQVVVGQQRDDQWYVAFTWSVRSRNWRFTSQRFPTAEAAMNAAVRLVIRKRDEMKEVQQKRAEAQHAASVAA